METPDVTPVQKLATAVGGLITAILLLVNVFGWADIDALEGGAIMGVYVAFASVLMAADAVIRHGRSRHFQQPSTINQYIAPKPAADALAVEQWPGEDELQRLRDLERQTHRPGA